MYMNSRRSHLTNGTTSLHILPELKAATQIRLRDIHHIIVPADTVLIIHMARILIIVPHDTRTSDNATIRLQHLSIDEVCQCRF